MLILSRKTFAEQKNVLKIHIIFDFTLSHLYGLLYNVWIRNLSECWSK